MADVDKGIEGLFDDDAGLDDEDDELVLAGAWPLAKFGRGTDLGLGGLGLVGDKCLPTEPRAARAGAGGGGNGGGVGTKDGNWYSWQDTWKSHTWY